MKKEIEEAMLLAFVFNNRKQTSVGARNNKLFICLKQNIKLYHNTVFELSLLHKENNAIKTKHVKAKIDHAHLKSKCKFYGERSNKELHCKRMKQTSTKEYKTRYDWVGKVIHWELCKIVNFYLVTKSESVQANKQKILDFEI